MKVDFKHGLVYMTKEEFEKEIKPHPYGEGSFKSFGYTTGEYAGDEHYTFDGMRVIFI